MSHFKLFVFRIAVCFILPCTPVVALAQSPESGQVVNPSASSTLDFETYRAKIEPLFLKQREGDVTCYACHSQLQTRLRLQPFEKGKTAWTEDQSRRNFEVVSKLVVPGDPLHSHLLLHPLAHEAGGDPFHTGGKFWKTQDDPEWKMIADWIQIASRADNASSAVGPQPVLDFEFFKQRVEPVFLQQRPGHARCYACHTETNNNFRLQVLTPDNATWTDQQSRLNFESASRHVAPGDLAVSRLLLHPLAPEAGGDDFHSGGRQFASKADPGWRAMAEWVQGAKAEPSGVRTSSNARSPASLIYLVNNAADTVEAIDPASNTVVQVICGIEVPHGVNFSHDGSRIFVSSESDSSLVVVDRQTSAIIARIGLSGRPNNIAATKDKRQILVGIRSSPGAVDVISADTFKIVKTIPMKGSVHNVFVTPDGKYAIAGSIEAKSATVIDLQSLEPVWSVQFDRGVRPMAFEIAADGSTSRVFIQLSGFHGFAVVDFDKHAEIARIQLPDAPSGFGTMEGRTSVPSHGIGAQPGGKKLWVASTAANAVFAYSLPDLRLLDHVSLPVIERPDGSKAGSVPEWITFTPDGKTIYVSDSALKLVSAIDTESMQEIAQIPVGEVPKRLNTLVLDNSSQR
jgi:YVTN family beta-propeller protein